MSNQHDPRLEGARILLVDVSDEGGENLESELRQRGAELTRTSQLPDAARWILRRGFDVTVLSHPLPGLDPVAACAALREAPMSPPLILLEPSGESEELRGMLPEGMRPETVLPRSVHVDKLVEEICSLLDAPVEEEPAAATRSAASLRSLPEVLMELHRGAETGALDIRSDGVCTTLYLNRGEPLFAEGGSLRETLGRMLLRHGQLSEADYVRVIDRMTASVIDNEPLRIGDALTELGLMTEQEVHKALATQVREKITVCFQWPRFEHSFRPMDELPERLLEFSAQPIRGLILQGIKLYFGPQRVEALLGPHANLYPRLTANTAETAAHLGLEADEAAFLERVSGAQTVTELRECGALDSHLAGQLLAALVVTGEATLAAAPGARTENLLPPRKRAKSPAPAAPEANESPPRNTGDVRDMLEAERLFRQARELLTGEQIEDAQKLFRKVAELQPLEPEYRMWEAWTEYLTIRAEATLARAKASACAQRMLQLDADSAKAHSILGRLAYDSSDLDKAEREFAAALARDPDDLEAQIGLRVLSDRNGD